MSLCAMAELKLCCKRRYESRQKDTDEATEGVKRHKINLKEGTIAEHEDVNHDGLPALFIINITRLPPLPDVNFHIAFCFSTIVVVLIVVVFVVGFGAAMWCNH